MPPAVVGWKVNPFEFGRLSFPVRWGQGGFDVIVGNPPYIRIQNMTVRIRPKRWPYQSPLSPYSTARQDNFDKYALFLDPGGR